MEPQAYCRIWHNHALGGISGPVAAGLRAATGDLNTEMEKSSSAAVSLSHNYDGGILSSCSRGRYPRNRQSRCLVEWWCVSRWAEAVY